MPQMLNLTCYQDSSHLRQTSSSNLLLGLSGELKFRVSGCGIHSLEIRHPLAHSLDDPTEHNFRRKRYYVELLTISLDGPWVEAYRKFQLSSTWRPRIEFDCGAAPFEASSQACTISTSVSGISTLQKFLRKPEKSLCLLKSFGIPLRHR